MHLLVVPLRELHMLELERLLVQLGSRADTGELPRRDVRELLVVAARLAIVGLVLDPVVTAAAFLAFEGVEAHELAELQEVGDAARLLERLVELLLSPEHPHVTVEILTE